MSEDHLETANRIAELERENAELRAYASNVGPELTKVEAELLVLGRSTINRIQELRAWFKGWDARLYQMQGDINRMKRKLGMEN